MKRLILIMAVFVIMVYFALSIDRGSVDNEYVHNENLVKKVIYTESSEEPPENIPDLISLNNSFVSISKKVIPAVVSINTEKKIKISRRNNPFGYFFSPFGDRNREYERRFEGLGSGIIISSDGYIITNNHVIDKADKNIIKLSDNKTYEAKVVGTDKDTDIALLKINAKNLPVVVLGNSDNVEVGQWVLAVGSPLTQDLSSTVTVGIVSGIGRNININRTNNYSIENFIQTDAAINPGNSGGPLINIYGEVIGINTAIMSKSGFSQGYAFAIPINIIKNVVSDLRRHGEVTRGYIGIRIGDVLDTDDMEAHGLDKPEGVIIQGFTKGGAAEESGLEISDVIIEIDGKNVIRRNELQSVIASKDPGDEVVLTIFRKGIKKYITVALRARTEDRSELISEKIEEDKTIGMTVEKATKEYYLSGDNKRKGVVISDVDYNSRVFKKGLRKGDMIWKIGDVEISSIEEYESALKQYKGKAVLFFVVRYNTEDTFVFSLRIPN